MANWRTCKAFLQIKSKKGAAAENRNGENKSQPKSFDSKKVIPGLTFANATYSDQQRTAHVEKTEPAKKKSKPVSDINQEGETTSGLISAEFRKLFQSFPGLIEARKALKNVKSPEERLDIYFGFSRKLPMTNPGLELHHGTRTVSDHVLLNL
ncbi:hypothetical protein TNIN_383531 [Trichonephila inaurata madagascariensis]|uniref:Uncharacterized protein n=1 Tax=Trichonephila inaurata madagascariensis TaxID=2747483 RepID=A0A8X6XWR5_9ARAC|nr:hypothetical protein TNIN_383531 [Trichonephila inaurata madagascariensis]